MHIHPFIALFAWIPISLLFFRWLPIRVAFLANFIAGWALLPAANYAASNDPFPFWILGTTLESDYFITKASVLGACGLLAIVLYDRSVFKRFRLTVWDLPMGMWLIAPLLAGIANPGALTEGFLGEAYQLLAWGSPYIIGRLYFTDTQSLRMTAKAFVIGGLAYIPFCCLEFTKGPWIYAAVYGYQPFQMLDAERFFGLYRPIGLLETGTQLGIWMATATLIAVWLWARKATKAILGIPILLVAFALLVTTVMCQSTEATILLLALIPFVFVDPRQLSRTVSILLVVGILAFAGIRMFKLVSIQDLIDNNTTVHSASEYLKSHHKGSLERKLTGDEGHMAEAMNAWILGYGRWDWWTHGVARPWGLWLLIFGMYGSLGLASLEAMLLIPALRAVWFPLARSDIAYTNMRHMLSAALLISAIDTLTNSTIILPLMLVIGGMTIWSTNDTAVEIDYEKPAAAGTPLWRGSQNAPQSKAEG